MTADPRRSDDVLELLEACDPLSCSDLAEGGIQNALDEVGTAVTRRPRAAAPKRGRLMIGSRRALLVVAAAILAVSVGVATGAVVLAARTGLLPTKAEEAVGGPGELLNPVAPDFRAVALEIASDIPYPKGYDSWREWVLELYASNPDPGDGGAEFPEGLVSSGALHGWLKRELGAFRAARSHRPPGPDAPSANAATLGDR